MSASSWTRHVEGLAAGGFVADVVVVAVAAAYDVNAKLKKVLQFLV